MSRLEPKGILSVEIVEPPAMVVAALRRGLLCVQDWFQSCERTEPRRSMDAPPFLCAFSTFIHENIIHSIRTQANAMRIIFRESLSNE